MTTLLTAIQQARKHIQNHKGRRGLNEQNTKGALIEPILRALGWDVEDPDEVTREYTSKKRDRPVDYALRVMRSPRLFVEAKALGMDLSDRKWAGQVIGYASVAGVKWAVLTDGNHYRIYNTHAPVDVEKKLFRVLSIVENDEADVADTLRLLSRKQMEENRLEALWSMHFVDQQVQSTLEQLFGNEPDSALVRLLAKTTSGITPKEIRASLGRLRIDLNFPVIMTVDPSGGDDPKLARKPRTSSLASSAKDDKQRGSVEELIATGAIQLPLEIEKTYKGQTVRAVIEKNGTITMNGKSYSSLSQAASVARRRVLGTDRALATNGWKFWRYRKKDGTIETLADLRDRASAAE